MAPTEPSTRVDAGLAPGQAAGEGWVWTWSRWWRGALMGVALAAAAQYFQFELRAFLNLHFFAADYGLYDNTIWNIAHGRGFYAAARGRSYLAEHVSPILALFAPLYRLWDTPLWPMLFQAAAFAASGILLVELARRLGVPPLPAAVLLLVYHFELLAQRVYLAEFHTVALQAPLVFAFVLAALGARLGPALTFAALLLATREDAFLGLAPLAALLAWRQRSRGLAAIAAGALLYGGLVVAVVYPTVAGASLFSHRRDDFKLFLGLDGLRELFRWTRVEQLYLLLPHAIPAAFASWWLLAAVAPLGQILLAGHPRQYHLTVHYSATLRPYLFLCMAAGLGALARAGARRRSLGVALASGTAALALSLALGPMPPFPRAHPVYREVSPRYRQLYALIGRIPRAASVAAPDHLFPHVSHREQVWRYVGDPIAGAAPEHYLLDAAAGRGRLLPADLARLVRGEGYSVEAVAGRFALLRRGGGRVHFEAFRDLFYLLEVEGTPTEVGEDVPEDDASTGVARRAVNRSGRRRLVFFGRPWPLGAGEHRAAVRVRNPSSATSTGDLEVLGRSSRGVLARTRFRLDPAAPWQLVEAGFALGHAQPVEIRLAVDPGSAVVADVVTVDGPGVRRAFAELFGGAEPPG